ncbi:hypothetical protein JY651_37705 [Pyxidicoccus parkwayensis]|uniref:Uncharacterized protein n=1 Tax=Pyxidicoccus parkwayensis TaxID=2813578 RepID=A0ABX7NTX3_9BACT|nr:hypothetical protein [Pyxidicoccus parkwaysis]QSQ20917.1 hypothetical protein JY651_37705 [Pyxidicoccus parkwaysis]
MARVVSIISGIAALIFGFAALFPVLGLILIPLGFLASAMTLGFAALGRSWACAVLGGLAVEMSLYAVHVHSAYGYDQWFG